MDIERGNIEIVFQKIPYDMIIPGHRNIQEVND